MNSNSVGTDASPSSLCYPLYSLEKKLSIVVSARYIAANIVNIGDMMSEQDAKKLRYLYSFRIHFLGLKFLVDIQQYLIEQGVIDKQAPMSEVIREVLTDYYIKVVKPNQQDSNVSDH